MKIFTRLEGKLAQRDVDTPDPYLAINMVRREIGEGHTSAILALIESPKQMELFDDQKDSCR